ncbi:hypothetical protein D3C81_1426520 [compost metagenome]
MLDLSFEVEKFYADSLRLKYDLIQIEIFKVYNENRITFELTFNENNQVTCIYVNQGSICINDGSEEDFLLSLQISKGVISLI